MTVSLRPYQQQAIDDLRASFAAGKKAPLLVMPTGSGKTYTYSAISEGAAKRGNRIVILEHRKELLRQASCSLGALGVKHQIIAPADKIADIRRIHVKRLGWPMVARDAHVAVASVQTLIRRLDWLQEFDPDLIVVDEGDLALASSWARIFAAAPRARKLGVTASPVNTQGVGMDVVYDDLILGPTMRELIEMGALCRPRVFAPAVSFDFTGIAHKGGDIDPSAAAAEQDKPSITGNAVEHYRELAPGRPAIVFCCSVLHAEHVAAEFRGAGFRFEVVTGDMEDDDRDDRIFGLATGKYHGIVTVDVVSRGTDIPVAEVAILLRPTESLALYLQQVGRVLRPAEGKEWGLILDHAGNVERHGMPHYEHEWTLEGRKKGRGGKRETDPEARAVQCPTCHGWEVPREVCGCIKADGTKCEHKFEVQSREIKYRAGHLEEVTEENPPMPKIQTGKLQNVAQMKAAGISTARAQHILAARAEKEKLQTELRDLLTQWAKKTGIGVRDGWGFAMADIRDMKPKALREHIEKVGGALFLDADNDNNQVAQATA